MIDSLDHDEDRPRSMIELFGGPRLAGELAGRSLSPHQAAFLAIVYARRKVSRPEISRILWRRDADRRTRASIRQLRHQVARRAGRELVGAEGDVLTVLDDVDDDFQLWRLRLDGGQLLEAARMLRSGFLARPLPGVRLEFLDWKDRLEGELRTRLESAARVAWASARDSEAWDVARDAAEALYLLRGSGERDYEQIIEARAKSGSLLAAEVAYADYAQRLDGKESNDRVEALMERVRSMARSQEYALATAEVPFVGREDELRRLRRAVDRVSDGEFTVAIVSGESGIGKSRLLAEVRRLATLDGIRCLAAQPVELEKRISLNPILDALSGLDLEPHLTRMGEPWRTVVGAMLPSSSPSATREPPPPIDETALSRRLMDAFSLLLHSLADEEPTILFIDDLQWVDATTIAILEFYGRRWSNSRFGIAATMRSDCIQPRDPIHALIGQASSRTRVRIDLPELSVADGRQLIEHASEDPISDRQAEALFDRVGTHPLYLLELVKDRKEFALDSWGEQWVPASLRQIAANRLATLSKSALRLAQLLAVIGKPAYLTGISALFAEDDEKLGAAISELRSRRLVSLGPKRLRLSHDLFRSVVYLNIEPNLREALHRRYAGQLRSDGDGALGELALHLDRGGRPAEAAACAIVAGDSAFAQGAMVEAADFFELAVRSMTSGTGRAKATAKQATALFLARDLRGAAASLSVAGRRLRECDLEVEALGVEIRRVETEASLGDASPEHLIERLSAIKSSAANQMEWESLALALDAELRVVQYMDRSGEADRVFQEMEDLAERGGASTATVCKMGLAMEALFGVSSEPEKAVRAAEEAVALSSSVPHHRLRALHRCLVVLQLRGRVHSEQTQTLLEEARELAKRQGDRRARYSIESNYATGLLDAGDVDRAEYLLDQAEQYLGSGDMDLARFHHACNSAEIALTRSEYAVAQLAFEEARTFLGAGTPPYSRAVTEAGLGICALETGDLASARRHEKALGSATTPYLIDPTTVLTFRCLLLDRRDMKGEALDLLANACPKYRGRAEMVWLKLTKMRLERMVRWQTSSEAERIAREALSVAKDCGLLTRTSEFDALERRLRASL